MRKYVWVVAIGLLAWMAWYGWQLFFVTDESRIRKLITTMKNAVEQNKTLALADCIARDYGDDRGMDKGTLVAMVRGTRSQYDAMFIFISDTVIEIPPGQNTATATIVARILTKRTGAGDAELNAERVRLFFRKTDNEWLMTRVESPELKFE
jgi:hypothetical protein